MQYIEAELEIIQFDTEDVITTSTKKKHDTESPFIDL